jgi:hypothetical protein
MVFAKSASSEGLETEAGTRTLVKVYLESVEQGEQIASIGVDIIEFKPSYLKVFITAHELAQIEGMGFRTEILELSEVIDQSVFGIADAGLYHTYDEVMAELLQTEADHTDIAKLYDIGDSIEGREIWALKISDNPAILEDEPKVLYTGAHHAREWISVEIPMYLANYLTDNYDIDPNITNIIDEREIWIVPMLNPDGVTYSQTVYTMWRKNKRDNNDNGVFEQSFDGVDLNRNYGYKWGYDDIGSRPDPRYETYRGTSAFSEPETQAIRDLAQQQDFVFAISFHSYGELILFPWGYVLEDTPDHKIYEDIAANMAQFNGYTYGNPKDGVIYRTNGDFDDSFYGYKGTLAYTFELGTMFIPPENQIEDVWLQNKKAALYPLLIADNPFQIYPSITIYTDKSTYTTGDTMNVGVNLTNPGDAITVGIGIWVDLPDGGKRWHYRNPSKSLAEGLEYSDPAWETIIFQDLPPGDYAWHAVIVDPPTNYLLSESISPWEFTMVTHEESE